MGNNLDSIKIQHVDKQILNKFIRVDFLEENSDVFSVTQPELITFLLRKYLQNNYNILKSKVENAK